MRCSMAMTLRNKTLLIVGLTVAGLIANAMKHAFPARRAGVVPVGLTLKDEGDLTSTVADDGLHLPEDRDIQDADSLGLQLVTDLVKQLSGTLDLQRDHGSMFAVALPNTPVKSLGKERTDGHRTDPRC